MTAFEEGHISVYACESPERNRNLARRTSLDLWLKVANVSWLNTAVAIRLADGGCLVLDYVKADKRLLVDREDLGLSNRP